MLPIAALHEPTCAPQENACSKFTFQETQKHLFLCLLAHNKKFHSKLIMHTYTVQLKRALRCEKVSHKKDAYICTCIREQYMTKS